MIARLLPRIGDASGTAKETHGRPLVRSLAILGGIAVLSAACADSRGAGGTGSETTALSARVLSTDGRPVARALVRLIDVDRWGRRILSDSAAAVDSVETDSAGWFRFDDVEGGAYAVEVQGSREALHLDELPSLSPGESRSLGVLRLQAVGRVEGAIRCAAGRPVRVLLAGTASGADVDSTGGFVLDAVPPGDYDLLVGIEDGSGVAWQRAGRVRVPEGASVAGSDFDVAPRQVLLDDFDDGDDRSSLARLQHAGGWFYHDDSAHGGDSRLEPVAAEADLGLAMTDSGAWSGSSLRARFHIGGAGTSQFALVGVEIAPRAVGSSAVGWVDLGGMDSLVFRAKGSGRVRIQFATRAMARLSGGTVQFESAFALDGGWTRVSIPRSSIALPSGSSFAASWDTASREVRSIHFLANQDVDLWLDELAISGVDLRTFVGGAK